MFKLEFEVRDNEIDQQGVVNNANYFIYCAHARHKYFNEIGFSFAKLAEENQMLFLISTQMEFKKPLVAEDKFYVTCQLVSDGKIKIGFEQEVRKIPDETLMVKAYNVGVCVDANKGNRPYIPELLIPHLKPRE